MGLIRVASGVSDQVPLISFARVVDAGGDEHVFDPLNDGSEWSRKEQVNKGIFNSTGIHAIFLHMIHLIVTIVVHNVHIHARNATERVQSPNWITKGVETAQ